MLSFILSSVKGLINTHFIVIMIINTTSSYYQTESHNSSEVPMGNAQELNWNKVIVLYSIYFVLALTAIIGNGFVLYSATKNVNLGPLRYMDDVIKSLAIADMLFGLLGVPSNIINSYLHYNLDVGK